MLVFQGYAEKQTNDMTGGDPHQFTACLMYDQQVTNDKTGNSN